MALGNQYTLYVFRDRSHISGGADVITTEDRKTVVYNLTEDQESVLSLRTGDVSGPVAAFIQLATPVRDATVVMPSERDIKAPDGTGTVVGFASTITKGGVYTIKFNFKDRHGFAYSWRNIGGPLASAALECWSETLNKKLITYTRPIYTPQDKAARFDIDLAFKKEVDFFLATAIAMEELDALKRGVSRKPGIAYDPVPYVTSEGPIAPILPPASALAPAMPPAYYRGTNHPFNDAKTH